MAGLLAGTFHHRRLDETKDEIRLFKISPGQVEGLNCHVEIFQLADCPPFIALSYVWGPPTPRGVITVNGGPFVIRMNLLHLLDAIRSGPVPQTYLEHGVSSQLLYRDLHDIWFFCDQICIDQTNVEEKNHQVAMMGRIYSTAHETVAWLGAAFNQRFLPLTFETQYVDNRMSQVHGAARWAELKRTYSNYLASPYWSRLWVTQEILLSRKVNLMCGDRIISWETMDRFTKQIQGIRGYAGKVRFSFYEAQGYRRGSSTDIPSALQTLLAERRDDTDTERRLSYVISSFGDLQCIDARDKIYGLLGLVPHERRVEVDYSLSTLDLLLRVMKKVMADETLMMFQSHMDFALLLHAKLGLTGDNA